MVANSLIQSPAYSLWLNDLNANTGSIMFGGVDTDKFHGSLATLPIQVDRGSSQPTEFFVALTGLSFGGRRIGGDRKDAVLLDSGSSLAYLPDDLVTSLYQTLNAQYDPSQGLATVSCDLIGSSTTLDFSFSGATISVPMAELVIPVQSSSGSPFGISNVPQVCLFAIEPAGGNTAVLGDPFLRSAYVVYDLGNNQISMAQTNFNATSSTIREIGTGKQAVPGASLVPSPATVTPGKTGGRIGVPTISGTITATATGAARTGGATITAPRLGSGLLAAVFGLLGVFL